MSFLNKKLVLGTLLVPFFALAYYDDGFLVENTAQITQQRWMGNLPNSRRWMQLSLPGTHDSGATSGGSIVVTQGMSITEQLKAGIRWFDLRAKWDGDKFPIYHGPIYQGKDLADLLVEINAYLKANPTESVTMRLSQEGDSGTHTWSSFGENFEKQYRLKNPNLFWMRNAVASRDVTLGEIRGKIYLLYDFYPFISAGTTVPGSHYRSCDIQDQYQMNNVTWQYTKWEAVKNQINRANTRAGGENCYVNYLSASGGVSPYFPAGGRASASTNADRVSTGIVTWGSNANTWPDFPRVGCIGSWCTIVYEGINTLTKNYLNAQPSIKYIGFMPADYPGPGLIKSIINVNFR